MLLCEGRRLTALADHDQVRGAFELLHRLDEIADAQFGRNFHDPGFPQARLGLLEDETPALLGKRESGLGRGRPMSCRQPAPQVRKLCTATITGQPGRECLMSESGQKRTLQSGRWPDSHGPT